MPRRKPAGPPPPIAEDGSLVGPAAPPLPEDFGPSPPSLGPGFGPQAEPPPPTVEGGPGNGEDREPAPAPKPNPKASPKAVAKPDRVKVDSTELEVSPDLRTAHLTINFSNGKPGHFDIWELEPGVQVRAAAFGIEQKIRKARDPIAVGKAIFEGTWPEGRSRGTATKFPLIVRAAARLTGVTEAEAYAKWQGLPDEGPNSKKALRGDPRIKGAIAAIKAEIEQSSIDVGALFSGGE